MCHLNPSMCGTSCKFLYMLACMTYDAPRERGGGVICGNGMKVCTSLLCRDGCTGIHTHAHTHTHTLTLTVTWLQSLLSFYLAHPLSPLSSRPTMSTSLSISGTKRIAPATSSFRNYVKKVQFSACNVSHHTVCMHHTYEGSRLTLLGIPLLFFS